jgi:hypothetical protein
MDAPTVLLRNEILEFSSNLWCDYSVKYMSYIETIPAFFVCIRKMVSPHHHFHPVHIIYQSLRSPSKMPNLYTFNTRPPLRNTFYDDKESLIDFLGSGEVTESLLELDKNGLKLFLLFSYSRA